MAQLYQNMCQLVGRTPLVRMNRVTEPGMAEVYGKHEGWNPGGSVKDRICLAMIEDAERRGVLRPGGVVVEPTSGNTGIGLALVCAVKGYRLKITMPESMSVERREILRSYGAEVILTPADKGMKGAIARAEEILAETPGSFMPQQFNNPANPEMHRTTTALEIWNDTDGKVDAFVAGVGTGGTVTGVGEVLRQRKPSVKIYTVEPDASPVLSGGAPGPHRIQGMGAGFVPQVLNTSVYERVIRIRDEDAYAMMKRLATEEGILCGISTGANCLGALEVAREVGPGKLVIYIICDTGERYLSIKEKFGEA
ncbi:MAG: cysteine synthase A [Candidatus Sumerlaeia bacterium]|nr:cysteine synthase A [Candidatus Sumerlaeia bacterium]